jgi:hypothetical protein
VLAGSEQIERDKEQSVKVQAEEAQIEGMFSEEVQPPLRVEVQEKGVIEGCQGTDVPLTNLVARVLRGRRRAAKARTERERGRLSLDRPRTLVEEGAARTEQLLCTLIDLRRALGFGRDRPYTR